MKIIIPGVLLAILLAGCDLNSDIRQQVYAGDAPFADQAIVTKELDKKDGILIVEKRSFWGSVNYYAIGHDETFLLNMDSIDEGEKLTSYTWYNNYFIFHITNSVRFPGTTRLAVYAFDGDVINEVLDEKTLNILYYYFQDSRLYYVDSGQNAHVLDL